MNPQVDIDALTDAVCARLRDNFGHFVTVEAYREDRSRLPLPACLIELVDMEPVDEDDGTEQLQMSLRFMATVIVGFREIKAKMAVRKLAADVAVCIHKWHFATGSQPAMVTSVSQENFMPELDKFEAWSVEFEVKAWLGKSVWDEEQFDLLISGGVPGGVALQFDLITGTQIVAAPVDESDPAGKWHFVTPKDVRLSYSPFIGPDSEAAYVPLTGAVDL